MIGELISDWNPIQVLDQEPKDQYQTCDPLSAAMNQEQEYIGNSFTFFEPEQMVSNQTSDHTAFYANQESILTYIDQGFQNLCSFNDLNISNDSSFNFQS